MLIRTVINTDLNIERKEDLYKLKPLIENGGLKVNQTEIARALDIDRRTVKKYIGGYEPPAHRDRTKQMDQYYELIKELLGSDTQRFYYRRVLYQYLKDNHKIEVKPGTFYYYLKTVKEFDDYFQRGKISTRKSDPVIRFETGKGEQAQLDWKEGVRFVLKDTGEEITINVLVLLLSYSRFRVYKLALQMTRDVVLHLLTEMFEEIGGVTRTLLTDNMKTVMDKARSHYMPGVENKEFEAFAKDFGFKTVPCIAKSPQTKGKVEAPMKILDEICAYSGKLTLVELYDKVRELNQRVNSQFNQGTNRIPIDDFQKEKDSLLHLPPVSVRNQYRIKTTKVKVNTASMINIRSNQYSVPSRYIGRSVEYQIHDGNVYVYYNTRLIAAHALSDKKLNYSQEHYVDIIAARYKGRDGDEITQMAKENLTLIGERYASSQ